MDAVLIIGRVLFASLLVTGGIRHFSNPKHLSEYAALKGVPLPKLANLVSGLMLVLGGASIILGVWADLGALIAAAVLLAMTVMHDFWKADGQTKQTEIGLFLRNCSLAGGALVMYAVVANADKAARIIGPMLTDGFFAK